MPADNFSHKKVVKLYPIVKSCGFISETVVLYRISWNDRVISINILFPSTQKGRCIHIPDA